jgi:hypothetical protein
MMRGLRLMAPVTGLILPVGTVGPAPNATGLSQYEALGPDRKVKALICPLFSCGRLFNEWNI